MHPPAGSSAHALLDRAFAGFRDQFGCEATHAARAPGSINLLGDHTDQHEGFTLSCAIDRQIIIVAALNHSQRFRIAALDLDGEMATFMNDPSLAPGRTPWSNHLKSIIARFASNGHPLPSFDAAIASDLPIGIGLGGSAAIEAATASLIELLLGIRLGAQRKARWCAAAHTAFLSTPAPLAHLITAAAARHGHALLIDCRSLEVQSIAIDPAVATLLIMPAGAAEQRSTPADLRPERIAECQRALKSISVRFSEVQALRDVHLTHLEQGVDGLDAVAAQRVRHLITENARVRDAAHALAAGDYETVGFLMNESHRSLAADMQASSPELDAVARLVANFEGVHGARPAGRFLPPRCALTLVRPSAVKDLVAHLEGESGRGATPLVQCFPVIPSDAAGAVTVQVQE